MEPAINYSGFIFMFLAGYRDREPFEPHFPPLLLECIYGPRDLDLWETDEDDLLGTAQ